MTDEPMEESTSEVKESDETPTKDEPEMKAEEMNEVQEEMETETENKVNEGTEPENTETGIFNKICERASLIKKKF